MPESSCCTAPYYYSFNVTLSLFCRMPDLVQLDIGTITNIRYDGLSGIFRGLYSIMHSTPLPAVDECRKLASLESLTVRFGEEDARKPDGDTGIMDVHWQAAMMHYDLLYAASDNGGGPLMMDTRALSGDNAPRLRDVYIIGFDSPCSTLRIISFLQSLLKHPPDTRWENLSIRARFLPTKVSDTNHPFRVALNATVARNIHLLYTYTYMPGYPVDQ